MGKSYKKPIIKTASSLSGRQSARVVRGATKNALRAKLRSDDPDAACDLPHPKSIVGEYERYDFIYDLRHCDKHKCFKLKDISSEKEQEQVCKECRRKASKK